MDVYLGPWEKVLILAVAALIVFLSLVILSCFIMPGCMGYIYLHGKKKVLDDQIVMIELPKKKTVSVLLNGSEKPPLYNSVGPNLYPIHCDLNGRKNPFDDIVDVKSNPTLKITLELHDLHLMVQVLEASNLPIRDYPSPPSIYIEIKILKKVGSIFRKKHSIYQKARTATANGNLSPAFRETVTFPLKTFDLNDMILTMSAFDEDPLTRTREICFGEIALGNKKLFDNPETMTISLKNIVRDLGKILVGLIYLPTAQRLNIKIVKAMDLHLPKNRSNLKPFIRVLLMDCYTKIIHKKKIVFTVNGNNFFNINETMFFSVGDTKLEGATCIVLIGIEESGKERIYGFFTMGSSVKDIYGRLHWNAILQTPRTVFTQWHTLR